MPVVITHTQDLNLCLLVMWYRKTTFYGKLKLVGAGWGFGWRPFCFGLHSVMFFFCVRARSLSAEGPNMGTCVWLAFCFMVVVFFFYSSPLKACEGTHERYQSPLRESLKDKETNQKAAGHRSRRAKAEKNRVQGTLKLQGHSLSHTHVCFRHPLSPFMHTHTNWYTDDLPLIS